MALLMVMVLCEWHGRIWMQANRHFCGIRSSILRIAVIVTSPTPRVVQSKRTALMRAIDYKNDAMVAALLDHNANPDIQDGVRQGPQ